MPPTLSDVDRRTIANLSVPRNVASLTHELRIDPHSPTRPDDAVNDHLGDLEKRGLVVNLGSHGNVAELAASLERHKTALVMPDDKAAIWSRRRATAKQSWEVDGDLYLITNEGVDTLHQPVVEDKAFTTSELEDLVRAQFECVLWDAKTISSVFEPGDTFKDPADSAKLAGEATRWWNPHAGQFVPLPWLLPEEFHAWLDDVLDAHEKRSGKAGADGLRAKFKRMIAGGVGWSDVYENRLLDHENQKTAMPALVTPWFMGLTILAYTDSDTPTTAEDGSHKPTYTGYARASTPAASLAAAAAGSAANTSAIVFAACTAGSSTILGFGNFETSGTTGDFRKYGTCASTTVSTTQTPAQFAIGAYVTTAD